MAAQPAVPIDCSALLCRPPSAGIAALGPPARLAFLERILRDNARGAADTASDSADEPGDRDAASTSSAPTSAEVPVHRADRTPTEALIPPENFAMVNTWVYRSSFPKKKHFPFLRTLRLRSVLTLILEDYPAQNINFLDENGITFFQYGIPGNKEPFVQIPEETITAALTTILDRRNHPILIHCNKGKHRTGCLIGCLRKLQQWSLTTIFDEYRRFSFPKARSMDQEFIELYREGAVWPYVRPDLLPRWSMLVRGEVKVVDSCETEEDMRAM
ncbi:protein-tyrosine-phosphatase [Malassezia sp. CBS 17886]|nr:protein-tyrosine-phosphatase [Malassezia sp. CBS 17886]